MSEKIKPLKGQDYNQIKYHHSVDNLFEDPLFPTSDQSLCYSQMPPQGVRWLRPKEVHPEAKFVVGDFDRCDIDQGHLGNCWFIAGVVGIMQIPKVFAKVVPSDNSFDDGYSGCFHFRFWLYGEWVDVVVDDRLPYWPDGRLVYCSNKQAENEYWCPLLEKAYAKIYGSCYEVLDAGQTYDALIDMSGGIQEQFDLKKLDSNLRSNFWKILEKGFLKNSIMGCCIFPDPRIREARMSNGLVRGHAYTITKIIDLTANTYDDKLIRIRNPWGNDVEWKGAWSDGSREWQTISETEKSEIGLVNEKDGEFWMSFSDFMSNWDQMQICHLNGESYSDELLETDDDSDLIWKCTTYQSAWVTGSTAGGSGNTNQASFWTNPQFLITMSDVDKNDDENKADLIVSLMQKDSRLKRLQTRQDSCEEYIQFKLFKIKDEVQLDENKTSGLKLYANQLDRIGTSGSYINSREVTKRFRVDPGNYLIIPSTYDENRNSEFMMRVFTESVVESSSFDGNKDDLNDDDSFIDLTDEDNEFKHWINKLNPKVAKYKKFFSLQQNQDGHARLNVDFDGLVENLPDFPGSDLVKHGFKSFFN